MWLVGLVALLKTLLLYVSLCKLLFTACLHSARVRSRRNGRHLIRRSRRSAPATDPALFERTDFRTRPAKMLHKKANKFSNANQPSCLVPLDKTLSATLSRLSGNSQLQNYAYTPKVLRPARIPKYSARVPVPSRIPKCCSRHREFPNFDRHAGRCIASANSQMDLT